MALDDIPVRASGDTKALHLADHNRYRNIARCMSTAPIIPPYKPNVGARGHDTIKLEHYAHFFIVFQP